MSLVRYRCNDYSVPMRFGFRDVLVKGFVDEVVICAGARRSRGIGATAEPAASSSIPLHYLMLIETKPNALDQAAPLQGWEPLRRLPASAPSAGGADGQPRGSCR